MEEKALYLIGMCSVLVLGSVRGVSEAFLAMLTQVWPLAAVRSHVRLQVFQTRVRLVAALILEKYVTSLQDYT